MAKTATAKYIAASSQYHTITDASQTGLDITGDITIMFRIKLASLPSGNYRIVSKRGGSGVRSYEIQYRDDSGTKRFRFRNYNSSDSEDTYDYDITLELDTWYHVALTWDASASQAQWYINGENVGSPTGSNTDMKNTAAEFRLASRAGGAGDYMDGQLSEVRVYDDIRTEAEIRADMFSQDASDGNLQAYYKLSGDANDSSSNGNDLTATNSPTYPTNDLPFSDKDEQIAHSLDSYVAAQWKFNDDLLDESANDNDLTHTGTAAYAASLLSGGDDKSLDQEASNSDLAYIEDASQTDLDMGASQDFTIELMLNKESDSSQYVLMKGDNSGSGKWYGIYFEADGEIKFTVDNGTTAYTIGSGSFNLSNATTYYVAAVREGSTIHLYIDGYYIGSTSATSNDLSNAERFIIGARRNSGSYSRYFDGRVAEVVVTRRAKTAEEISKYYGGIVTARFIPDTTAVDGKVQKDAGASWSATRSASTATSADTQPGSTPFKSEKPSSTYDISRYVLQFPTGNLISSADINHAVIGITYDSGSGKNDSESTNPADLSLVSSSPASATTLGTADYASANWGTTKFADDIDLGDLSATEAYLFEFNSDGRDHITKAGISKFGIRGANDFADGTAPTARSFAYIYGSGSSGNEPFLSVEYIKGGTAYTQDVDETLTLGSSIALETGKVLDDAIALADSITKDVQKAFTDTVTLVASITNNLITNKQIIESITLTATEAVKITAKVLTDTVTAVANISFVKNLARTFTDTVTLVASSSTVQTFNRAFTESITLVTSIANVLSLGRLFTDSIGLEDRLYGLLNGVNMKYIDQYDDEVGDYVDQYFDI